MVQLLHYYQELIILLPFKSSYLYWCLDGINTFMKNTFAIVIAIAYSVNLKCLHFISKKVFQAVVLNMAQTIICESFTQNQIAMLYF